MDENKVQGVKDYINKAELSPEELGHLSGWLMMKALGEGITQALEDSDG